MKVEVEVKVEVKVEVGGGRWEMGGGRWEVKVELQVEVKVEVEVELELELEQQVELEQLAISGRAVQGSGRRSPRCARDRRPSQRGCRLTSGTTS